MLQEVGKGAPGVSFLGTENSCSIDVTDGGCGVGSGAQKMGRAPLDTVTRISSSVLLLEETKKILNPCPDSEQSYIPTKPPLSV